MVKNTPLFLVLFSIKKRSIFWSKTTPKTIKNTPQNPHFLILGAPREFPGSTQKLGFSGFSGFFDFLGA